ncbi:MAG: hypothetical protein ABJL57_00010 [Hyphomonas sp.]|uniref:hypothetical protein n=1 Tax=Hyphomonas sp. TaxID=87 RepID=UPI0032996677
MVGKSPATGTNTGLARFGSLTPLAPILLTVTAIWIASCWCYYALVEVLSLKSGYDEAPVLFAGYYLT